MEFVVAGEALVGRLQSWEAVELLGIARKSRIGGAGPKAADAPPILKRVSAVGKARGATGKRGGTPETPVTGSPHAPACVNFAKGPPCGAQTGG